jgi:hypothetical protein
MSRNADVNAHKHHRRTAILAIDGLVQCKIKRWPSLVGARADRISRAQAMSVQYDPASAKLIAVSSKAAAAATRKFSVLCPQNSTSQPQEDHVSQSQANGSKESLQPQANGSKKLLQPQADGSAAVRQTQKFAIFEPQRDTTASAAPAAASTSLPSVAPSAVASAKAPATVDKELDQESRPKDVEHQHKSKAKAAPTPSQVKRNSRKERKQRAQGRGQETSRQQLERALVARLQQWHTGAPEDTSALQLPVALAGVTDAFFDRERKELAFSAELLPHDRQLVHAAALRR